MLEGIAFDDACLHRDTTQQRRFIVVEGLYRNTGELCPLPELIELKDEFCYRLIVDESLSFGVFGRTGKGLTEYYNVDINEVDIMTISMDTSLAAVGGLCVGSREVVDHQRLSGAGYCFSASSPPFLSAVAQAALTELQSDPAILLRLHENSRLFSDWCTSLIPQLSIVALSPVMHLRLRNPPVAPDASALSFEKIWAYEMDTMVRISNFCIYHGVGILPAKYPNCWSPWEQTAGVAGVSTETKSGMPASLRPSLKVCISAILTEKQILEAVKVLAAAAKTMLKP